MVGRICSAAMVFYQVRLDGMHLSQASFEFGAGCSVGSVARERSEFGPCADPMLGARISSEQVSADAIN